MMAMLAKNSTKEFVKMCEWVRDALPCEWEYPDIKGPVIAQWANESGWGHSPLGVDHHNYGGMKWHKSMESFVDADGKPRCTLVEYGAWDGSGDYCSFPDWRAFVDGYFHRLDNHPAYDGWRTPAKKGGQAFVEYIAPVWYGKNQRENYAYLKRIRNIWEARVLGFLETSPAFYK